jgi:S1-C subfamily serine protease
VTHVEEAGMLNPSIAKGIFAVGRSAPTGIQLLGTAFTIGGEHLATTAHVTGPSDNDLCVIFPRIERLDDYQDTINTEVKTMAAKLAAYDPIRDIAILQIKADVTLSDLQVGSSDLLSVGSPVASIGYPHADHGRLVMTEQQSSVGARIILGARGVKTKHIVLNVQARPGQSGSPVLTDDGRVIAAMIIGSYAPGGGSSISLAGVDPHTLHQTTHAISAEYIRELLP